MKKNIYFRLPDEEFDYLEEHCQLFGRTKTDVLREFIRSLKDKNHKKVPTAGK